MYQPITHIYLDVDEVLVDWVTATLEVMGYDPARVLARWDATSPRPWNLFDVVSHTPAEGWRAIDSQGPAFWAELRPFPWFDELLAVCRAVAPVTLLTSPSLHHNSYAGKAQWMRKTFGDDFHDYAFTRVKHRFSHSGAVLIDDSPRNCQRFTTIAADNPSPGRAVLFPGVGNHLHAMPDEERVPYVVGKLEEMRS